MFKMLRPDIYLNSIFELTPCLLQNIGVCSLILDVDNTLRINKGTVPLDGVLEWIDSMKNAGISLIISSNNFKKNIEPFAFSLSIPYVAFSLKPLPIGLKAAQKKLNTKKQNIAIVGDQVFTDVFGGKLKGFRTILVKPILQEKGMFWQIRRFIERKILNGCGNKK